MDHHAFSLSLSTSFIFLLFLPLLVCTTTTTNAAATDFNFTTITFEEGYSPLFSDFNIDRSADDKSVRLLLNRHSGSGIISSYYYNYGFFSAKIKLPSNYTAGIVVAFYMSNVDTFDKNHDELDFEFLGNVKGKPWRIQTNMYGNGSLPRGREERYRLWFDPSKEFHRYSILWTPYKILYFVDQIPIREVVNTDAMGGDFPSKPMSVYATIWDASTWATNGGQNKVDYRFEPFASEFTDLILEGCPIDPIEQMSAVDCNEKASELAVAKYATVTPDQRKAMKWFREKYMYYTHCYDLYRYPLPMPECVVVPAEQALFKESGRLKEAQRAKFHRRHGRRHRSGQSRRQRGGAGSAATQSCVNYGTPNYVEV